MAEKDNGGAAPDGRRALAINAQYIKDLSFENPRAPHSLVQVQQKPPEVSLGIDVAAQSLAPDTYEVTLTLHAEAKREGERVFLVELTYAGVTTLANVPEAEIPLALFIETPRLLFPFARAIVASATLEGGFMPLMINQVDFADLLRRKQEAQQARAAASA